MSADDVAMRLTVDDWGSGDETLVQGAQEDTCIENGHDAQKADRI